MDRVRAPKPPKQADAIQPWKDVLRLSPYEPVYLASLGEVYAALPAGCVYSPISGTAYYACSGTWFSPYYGANGMYYRAVPPP